MTKQGLIGLCFVMGMAWAPARADAGGDEGPAVHPTVRSGWTGGIAVGMGELHQFWTADNGQPDSISEGAAVSLRIGKAVSQQTLFQLEIEYVMDGTLSSTMAGAYGQFYVSPRWWLRAGAGLTRLRQTSSGEPSMTSARSVPQGGPMVYAATTTVEDDRYSFGGLGGIGADYFQTKDLALSAEFTLMLSYYDIENSDDDLLLANVGLLLGIQWY